MMVVNLPVDDDVSALFAVANAPGDDHIRSDQAAAFNAVLPHIDRAVRVHRLLRLRNFGSDSKLEELERSGAGVILVDRAAKVLFANAWARALITAGSGLALRNGYLFSTDRAAILDQLIASCCPSVAHPLSGWGGEIVLRRCKRRPLRITVTPLGIHGDATELPWLHLTRPVALITISDQAKAKWLN